MHKTPVWGLNLCQPFEEKQITIEHFMIFERKKPITALQQEMLVVKIQQTIGLVLERRSKHKKPATENSAVEDLIISESQWKNNQNIFTSNTFTLIILG